MKKVLVTGIVTLTMGIALAACGGQSSLEPADEDAATRQAAEIATEITDPADDAADEWYKSVLEDDIYRQQYSHYALADINLDGVDELFLSTTADYFITDEDKACLLAYDNGEVKTLQEIGGKAGEYWHVNQSDATLTYFSRMSGEKDLTLYKLEGGELREVSTANYYAQHHYPERDTDEEIYLMDGKESRKGEYDSFWEQYGSEAGALTYDNEL